MGRRLFFIRYNERERKRKHGLMQELIDFRNSRGWDEAHFLSNLAKSVNIEAVEILEIFQWKRQAMS